MNACKNLRIPSKDGKQYTDYLVSGGDEKVIRMFEPALSFVNTLNGISNTNMRLFFENNAEEDKYLDPQSKDKVKYRVNLEATQKVLGLMNIATPVEKFDFGYGKEDDEEGGAPGMDNQAGGDDTKEALESYDYKKPPVEDFLVNHTLWPEANKFYGHGYEIVALATNSKGNLIASSCKS